jgi:hypothetical protein
LICGLFLLYMNDLLWAIFWYFIWGFTYPAKNFISKDQFLIDVASLINGLLFSWLILTLWIFLHFLIIQMNLNLIEI